MLPLVMPGLADMNSVIEALGRDIQSYQCQLEYVPAR